MNDQLRNLLFWLSALGLTGTSCTSMVGCAGAERDAQIATFKEVSLFAKEHGFAGQANLNIGGQPAFDLRTGGVLDTGISGSLNLQFNSLAQPRGAAETAVGGTVGMVEVEPIEPEAQ